MSRRHKFMFIAIVFSLCVHHPVHAQKRTIDEAKDIAKRFWNIDNAGAISVGHSNDEGYIMRSATQKGFVLVSGDKRLPAILAYDDSADYPANDIPQNVRSWIDGYRQMEATLQTDPESVSRWLQASSQPAVDVEPLLSNTTWGQDSPYNALCPKIDGKTCPTGCVATALAQIMRYHKWPITGEGSVTYRTATAKIPITFDFSSTTFQWGGMLDAYTELPDVAPDGVVIVNNGRFAAKEMTVIKDTSDLQCQVALTSLVILGESGFSGNTTMVLADENGDLVCQVSPNVAIDSPSSGRLLSSVHFILSIPASIPDGTYQLYNVVYAWNSLDWSITTIRNMPDDEEGYYKIEKSGDAFTIVDTDFACSHENTSAYSVATLMQAVGAAVKMDYKTDGSGASDSPTLNGLINYLKYDKDMYFVYPDEVSDMQWHQLLQEELSEGHPVYYTGQGKDGGHAFVIDGVQQNEENSLVYYHVNWGWNGLCNGYYLLNMLQPSEAGTGGVSGNNYSNSPSMLVGMKPDDGVAKATMTCNGLNVSRNELFAGQTLSVLLDRLVLRSTTEFKGTIQLELQPENDESTEPTVVYEEQNRRIAPRSGLSNYYMPCQIPMKTAAGQYKLVLVSIGDDGELTEINSSAWPRITVKPDQDWTAGSQTQSLQMIALGQGYRLDNNGNSGGLTVIADSVFNPLPNDAIGFLALLLCNKDGSVMAPLNEKRELAINGYAVQKNINIDGVLSRYLPDGDYLLRIGFLPQNDTLWTLCDQMVYDGNIFWANYAPFAIELTTSDGIIVVGNQTVIKGADIPWVARVSTPLSNAVQENVVYDLSGRSVTTPQRGIFIVNRKKKVIKHIQ